MLLVEKADYKLITRIHDEVKAKQISKKKEKNHYKLIVQVTKNKNKQTRQ